MTLENSKCTKHGERHQEKQSKVANYIKHKKTVTDRNSIYALIFTKIKTVFKL